MRHVIISTSAGARPRAAAGRRVAVSLHVAQGDDVCRDDATWREMAGGGWRSHKLVEIEARPCASLLRDDDARCHR